MAHHLTHHHPILLFHEALVPFLIRASARALPHVKTASLTRSRVPWRKRRWSRLTASRLLFHLLLSSENAVFVFIREAEVI
jgi:hypothetical protein